MADLTDAEINSALERGRIAQQTEPRATSARYDRKNGRVIVDLANGSASPFRPAWRKGWKRPRMTSSASVEILGAGYGLHWETLDADLSVPGSTGGAVRDEGLHGA